MNTFFSAGKINESHARAIVESSIKSWLDWSFLHVCGYKNEVITNIGASGNAADGSILQRVYDPSIDSEIATSGCVYEGIGREWVWESGVSTSATAPIVCSGVYVDSVFYGSGTTGSEYEHYIDFNRGRVVFTNPQSDIVQAEYSWKKVYVDTADSEVFRTIIKNINDNYDSLGTISPSGDTAVSKENRVYLPAVFIDTRDSDTVPFALGGGKTLRLQVLLHVIADNPWDCKEITDILSYQADRNIKLYNVNTAPFALNQNGSLKAGALEYPDLVNSYLWKNAYLTEQNATVIPNSIGLYRGIVRFVLEIDAYNL